MAEPLRVLDTSVIVRYLTGDVPHLAEAARRVIDSEVPVGVTPVALLEAAHVLSNAPYSHDRRAVVDALVALLRRENVQGVGVEAHLAAVALLRCRASGALSFGDALIAATGLSAGLEEAYSFDARFARAGLRVVSIPNPVAE